MISLIQALLASITLDVNIMNTIPSGEWRQSAENRPGNVTNSLACRQVCTSSANYPRYSLPLHPSEGQFINHGKHFGA
jgi:hypothetical protein